MQNAQAEAALGALLEAWRASGDPRTADAIDRLSAQLNESEPPMVAVGGTSGKKAWYAAVEAERPASLERLIEAVPGAIDRVKRLEALLAWPPDPRIGTAAKRWLEAPPVYGKNRPGFYKALWTLIEYTRDARLAADVARVGSTSHRPTSINRYGLRSWTALVELATHYAALPVPTRLSSHDQETLERIEALLVAPLAKPAGGTTADEAELFERVYDDPSDDEARIVLADLLQQRNDPRGEFIALQMARFGTGKPATSREKKLLQQWGRGWLGPLDECLLKDGLVFERGFPTRGRYTGQGTRDEIREARFWSTFTHLDVANASQYVGGSAELLVRLPALRHVTGLAPHDLSQLVSHGSFLWETVGFRLWTFDHERLVEAGRHFPSAHTLLLNSGAYAPLDVPVVPILSVLAAWPKVKVLELGVAITHMPAILESPRGKQLTRLTTHTRFLSATLEDGTLIVDLENPSDNAVAQLAWLVRGVRPKAVVVDADKKADMAPVLAATRELAIPLRRSGVES